MDCGSYSGDIVDVVSQHCRTFYIRAMMRGTLRDRIHAIPEGEWEAAEINYQIRLLVRLRPVQVGEMWRKKDAQAVHPKRLLPAASGVGHDSYGNSTDPLMGRGKVCLKYRYY